MSTPWNPFKKFFEDDEARDDSTLDECRAIVSFGNEPYFQKFMAYLDRGADSKIDTTNATSMLESAARINTFKDIKAHFKKQLREAVEVLDRESRNE